eukprot:1158374-Pelagomonas_calceolata.AAC.7
MTAKLQRRRKRGTWKTEETLPTSNEEKELHWLRRPMNPLHHKATEKKVFMGIWRVTGSTRLQILAVRSVFVFNSTNCGNKLVGIRNRMGMKFASKFIGTLVVKSQLLKVVEGVLSVACPTYTQ